MEGNCWRENGISKIYIYICKCYQGYQRNIAKLLGCVFQTKKNAQGEVVHHKAQLMAKCYA